MLGVLPGALCHHELLLWPCAGKAIKDRRAKVMLATKFGNLMVSAAHVSPAPSTADLSMITALVGPAFSFQAAHHAVIQTSSKLLRW